MLKYHIQTIDLSSTVALLEFTSIPQTFTDLVLVANWRHSRAATDGDAKIEFNGSTSGYSNRILYGNGSGTSSFSQSQILLLGSGGSATANTFSNNIAYIINYTSSGNKAISSDLVTENNATSVSLGLEAATWANTTSITSMRITSISGNIVANSSFSLYGIKRGSDGQTINSPIVEGGTVTTSGGYTYHTFRSSQTVRVNRDLSVETLLVAGGGSSGNSYSGGGGAGGVLQSSVNLSAGQYYALVGAGGSPTTNGSNSRIDSFEAIGGGRGANGGRNNGLDGGSGGGGGGVVSSPNTLGGLGVAGQGNNGGQGTVGISNYELSGGGGGAGAVGGNATTSTSGNGGAGTNAYSAWASATSSGASGYYAGGGAGGHWFRSSGTAGIGGGGSVDTPGTANTGGGGGGRYLNGAGFAGGSGIVIIRYLTP